jgi:hypothetical protein
MLLFMLDNFVMQDTTHSFLMRYIERRSVIGKQELTCYLYLLAVVNEQLKMIGRCFLLTQHLIQSQEAHANRSTRQCTNALRFNSMNDTYIYIYIVR